MVASDISHTQKDESCVISCRSLEESHPWRQTAEGRVRGWGRGWGQRLTGTEL